MDDEATWLVSAKVGAGLDGPGLVELLEEAGLEILEAAGGALPRALVRARPTEMALLLADHGLSVTVEPGVGGPGPGLLTPAPRIALPRRDGR